MSAFPTIVRTLAGVAAIPLLAAQLPDLSSDEIGRRISRTEAARLANLPQYTVVRKYTLHNTHMSDPAEMTVRLTYQKGAGKTFEIVKVKNASGITKHVMEKIISGEADSSHKRNSDLYITTANYDFKLLGTATLNGKPCYVVQLLPKRKSKLLLDGKAYIDSVDFGILRIEGRPSASLSFWVGKPYIVQDFEKVGGFYMASHNQSFSKSHLLGSTTLTIDYSDYDMPALAAERVASHHETVD